MNTVAEEAAQEKKDVAKEPITAKRWVAAEKKFAKPFECVAERGELNGKPFWRLYNKDKGTDSLTLESEITDKGGTVWVVKSVINEDGAYRYRVEKKAVAKD